MALNQQDINVGAAPNDGQGDPIRTAFIKTNDNFTQLYSLPNPTPPSTLVGTANDMPGMYAYTSSSFYYCFAPYDGVSTIWAVAGSGGSASSITNGLSNVNIAFANSNITVGVNGTSNVGVFSSSGLTLKGALNANTITTGSLLSGNFIISGDTISSLGETITITPAGNVIYGEVTVNADFSILGNSTTTESKVVVLSNTANAAMANLSGIQVGQANYASFLYDTSNAHWYASGNIAASGYRVLGGNINGAFNIAATNAISATELYSSNTIIGSNITGTRINSNAFVGDAGYVSNVQGANVVGEVAFANVSNYTINSVGANYALYSGTVTNNAQPNITSVGPLNQLVVSGNLYGNIINCVSINTATNITANGVITAPYIGTAPATLLRGTLSGLSNAQPNITSLGTITALTAGTINASGDIATPANIYGGNIFGNLVGSINTARFVTENTQSNINQLGVLNSVVVSGNIDAQSSIVVEKDIIGNTTVAANSTITMRNVYGNVVGSSLYTLLGGTLRAGSSSQPNVTSLGNLVSLNVDGNAIFGTVAGNTVTISGNTITTGGAGTTLNLEYNVIIPGNLTVKGNTTTVNSNTVAINDLTFVVANNASTASLADGAGLFVGPDPTHYAGLYYLATPNTWNFDIPLSVAGNIDSTASINAVGNIYAPSFNWSNGSPVISSTGNLSATNATFTGNVTAAYFNGTATSAQYADLAENYLADAQYIPGTVVSFGGPKEVTVSIEDLDILVAGVISTNPAYIMNSGLTGNFTTPVALMGRVPCRVTGKVTRGALMVSNGDGTARAEKNPVMGSVIGKALESFDGDVGVIEIVVGKL